VIILATDDTFRRFGFLMGSTKSSEWFQRKYTGDQREMK
jgi:hypothetical protein